jgi:hypothetical protein
MKLEEYVSKKKSSSTLGVEVKGMVVSAPPGGCNCKSMLLERIEVRGDLSKGEKNRFSLVVKEVL